MNRISSFNLMRFRPSDGFAEGMCILLGHLHDAPTSHCLNIEASWVGEFLMCCADFTALSSQAFRNPLWDWEYGSSMPHIRLLENASWYQLKVPATQVLPEMSSISGVQSGSLLENFRGVHDATTSIF